MIHPYSVQYVRSTDRQTATAVLVWCMTVCTGAVRTVGIPTAYVVHLQNCEIWSDMSFRHSAQVDGSG